MLIRPKVFRRLQHKAQLDQAPMPRNCFQIIALSALSQQCRWLASTLSIGKNQTERRCSHLTLKLAGTHVEMNAAVFAVAFYLAS